MSPYRNAPQHVQASSLETRTHQRLSSNGGRVRGQPRETQTPGEEERGGPI